MPNTFQELVVSFPYTITLRNEKFLLFDSGVEDKERILLFSTSHNLELLSETKSEWFVDGTFKSSPYLFAQILTIHVLKFNTVIPLVYALFPNKTKCTYKRLIVELKKLRVNIKSFSIMMDLK